MHRRAPAPGPLTYRARRLLTRAVGTSTGGLLAVAIGLRKLGLDDCEHIYKVRDTGGHWRPAALAVCGLPCHSAVVLLACAASYFGRSCCRTHTQRPSPFPSQLLTPTPTLPSGAGPPRVLSHRGVQGCKGGELDGGGCEVGRVGGWVVASIECKGFQGGCARRDHVCMHTDLPLGARLPACRVNPCSLPLTACLPACRASPLTPHPPPPHLGTRGLVQLRTLPCPTTPLPLPPRPRAIHSCQSFYRTFRDKTSHVRAVVVGYKHDAAVYGTGGRGWVGGWVGGRRGGAPACAAGAVGAFLHAPQPTPCLSVPPRCNSPPQRRCSGNIATLAPRA